MKNGNDVTRFPERVLEQLEIPARKNRRTEPANAACVDIMQTIGIGIDFSPEPCDDGFTQNRALLARNGLQVCRVITLDRPPEIRIDTVSGNRICYAGRIPIFNPADTEIAGKPEGLPFQGVAGRGVVRDDAAANAVGIRDKGAAEKKALHICERKDPAYLRIPSCKQVEGLMTKCALDYSPPARKVKERGTLGSADERVPRAFLVRC